MKSILDVNEDNYLLIKKENDISLNFNVKQLLPHSYPFLLVDKIVKWNPESNHMVGIKNVTHNEEFFNGHFSDFPIMPGVLIIEALAQTALIAGLTMLNKSKQDSVVRFISIQNAKFRKAVLPGDVLYLNVELIRSKKNIFKFYSRAYTGSDICTEAEFTSAFFDKEDEYNIGKKDA